MQQTGSGTKLSNLDACQLITDFHLALGQFLNYRLALQITEPDRILYLAVPVDTFESFFQERFVQEAVKLYQVKLIIYNPFKEEIIVWTE
ncbi:hypothetical protein NSMS1_44630 [Nostoc sp. MS1]|nr:hypothetical protein NSMS1_44630 [Nostoc sp. MS1]